MKTASQLEILEKTYAGLFVSSFWTFALFVYDFVVNLWFCLGYYDFLEVEKLW
jgi:hypothetical protein